MLSLSANPHVAGRIGTATLTTMAFLMNDLEVNANPYRARFLQKMGHFSGFPDTIHKVDIFFGPTTPATSGGCSWGRAPRGQGGPAGGGGGGPVDGGDEIAPRLGDLWGILSWSAAACH